MGEYKLTPPLCGVLSWGRNTAPMEQTHFRSTTRPIKEVVTDGGRKVVGGSAKGWTPLGPKLIGELVPGGNIAHIYFQSPQFEKDRVNQVKNVKIQVLDLIIAPWKFTPFHQRVNP